MKVFIRLLSLVLLVAGFAPVFAAEFVFIDHSPNGKGLSDPTPVTPVGGNTATTRGQARRNALIRAGELWGARLNSPIPIRVGVYFITKDGDCDALANAGPRNLFSDFPNSPRPGVYYSAAQAEAIARAHIGDPDEEEIGITFNSGYDDGICSSGERYYSYSLIDNDFRKFNFLAVAMHEIGHGLGFGISDVYYDVMYDEATGKFYPDLTDEEQDAALRSNGELVFNAPHINSAAPALTAGLSAGGHVRVFAPSDDTVRAGSAGVHFDVRVSPHTMLQASVDPRDSPAQGTNLALCVLKDMGWPINAGFLCPDPQGNTAPLAGQITTALRSSSGFTLVPFSAIAIERDGSSWTCAATTQPSHGTVGFNVNDSGESTSFIYRVNRDYVGLDKFSYRCNDGMADSEEGQLFFVVSDAPPPAPTNVSITPGDGLVSLTWSPSPNAVSYNIYMGTEAGAQEATPIRSRIENARFKIGGLSNGTRYFFKVAAVNASGISSLSAEVSAEPLPVPAVSISVTPSQVAVGQNATLSWSATGTSECTASGEWTGAKPVSGSRLVSGASSADFYYALTCSNVAGQTVAETRLRVVPAPPQSLSATSGDRSAILSWTAAAGASGYRVYRSTIPGDTSPQLGGEVGNQTNATVTGLSNGTKYYFVVRGLSAVGEGPSSNEASATPRVAVPAAPSNLVATAGDRTVALSWSPASGARTYNVYQGTTPGGESATPVATNRIDPNFNVTGLSNGTKYYFVVRGVNDGGVGPASNEASATPAVAVPAAPTNLVAVAGNQKVSLSWTAASRATTYNLYQGTSAGGESATPVKTGITGSSTDATGLSDGIRYYFVVRGVNSSGIGPASNEANATPQPAVPAAPANLTVTGVGDSTVSLSWDVAARATSYNLYQGTSEGGQSPTPVRTGITGTTISATGLRNGTRYYFVVRGVNAGGIGAASSEASATPQIAEPAAPTNLAATAGDGSVNLSWTGASGATTYNLYQGTSTGGESATPVKTGITGTTTSVTGLSNGTRYYFVVRGVNAGGTGAPSNEASATPQVALPVAPTNLVATAGDGSATLSWTAASGATSYNLYQGTSAGGESATPVMTGITGTTTSVTGLSNGTRYYFVVRGVNAGGTGAASNEVSATPQLAAPSAPTNLAATAGDQTVSLSWRAVAGATSYNLYQGTSAGGESATPARTGITGTTSSVTGLSNGTRYYFVVRGVNAGGTGPASNEASATPDAPVVDPAPSGGGGGSFSLAGLLMLISLLLLKRHAGVST